MQDRIEQELALLRRRYPDLEYIAEGRWIKIPSYPLPSGWIPEITTIAFQIPNGYPGTPPYGFLVPAGVRFKKQVPQNYAEPAGNIPSSGGGTWGLFSWSPHDGEWQPTANVEKGVNLLKWVSGFADRFREGV